MCDLQELENYREDTRSFVRWLGAETAQCGWSHRELARRSGLSAATVEGLMTGTARPTWELCAQLGHAFRLPPTVVFRQAGLLPTLPEPGNQRLLEALETLALLPDGPSRCDAAAAVWAVARHTQGRVQRGED
jgi:transcriptional regulator with XRE-family HTH domain